MFKNGLYFFPDKSLYHVVVHNSYLQISYINGKVNNFYDGTYMLFYSPLFKKFHIINNYGMVFDSDLKSIDSVQDEYTHYKVLDGDKCVGKAYLCRNNPDTIQIIFVPKSKEALYSQFVLDAQDFLDSDFKIPFTSYHVKI